jgi:hypothetical protein
VLAAAAALCLAVQPGADPLADGPPRLMEPLPNIAERARSPDRFVPAGWRMERTITGDLDRDGRTDLVAVIRGIDPNCIVPVESAAGTLDTNPRVLLVAFGTPSGFERRSVSARVIPRMDDPYADDPFNGDTLTIRAGVLRLGLTHWRSMGGWTTFSSTLSFRWDGRQVRLIGFDRESLQRNSGVTETISVNYLTGRAKLTTGSMEDDVDETTRWQQVAGDAPTLDTIGDGLAFEPRLIARRKR